jgi:hypothetical protein
MEKLTQGGNMDASQVSKIVRKRLKLEDDDWSMIEKNPKSQKLFQNANAFLENLLNERDPNEVMFNTSGCFDTGPSCGGRGNVVVKMYAELVS